MKVDELYSQDTESQIGVTFQRQPFETQVDIFPELNPLEGCARESGTVQEAGEPVGSALTSAQMEETLCRVMKHRGEEEFQPIPLKRVDSGPNSHNIQGTDIEEGGSCSISQHNELLDEIDNAVMEEAKGETKTKKDKKEGTLSRMKERLKNMRGEKMEKDEDMKSTTKSISKIFHRVNPVSKASRESFSKVFHRIGDALQRKEENGEEAKKVKPLLSLDRKNAEAVEKALKNKTEND